MALEKWTDWSKWQGDVGLASLQAMQRDGVVGVCVGAWHGLDANPYVRNVLARARGIGLKTACYIIINNRPGAWTVDQAREACGPEWDRCTFHSADVEVPGVTVAILHAALDRILEADGYPNIYTGAWFWNMWQPSRRFVDYGLWTANYNGRPDLDVPLYGGWGHAIGHQYAGTTHIYGTSVDLNVFDSDWIALAARRGRPETPPPPPPIPEEDVMGMTVEEKREFEKLALKVEQLDRDESRHFGWISSFIGLVRALALLLSQGQKHGWTATAERDSDEDG